MVYAYRLKLKLLVKKVRVKMQQIKASDFGRVGVLCGGLTEREVSLQSADCVLQALRQNHVDAHLIEVGADLVEPLLHAKVDRIFNVLHGGAGEGGIAQGVLQALALPYTDSDVLASGLALDKERSKWLWRGVGLPTPAYRAIGDATVATDVIEQLGLPLVIKTACGGSSLGVSIIKSATEFEAAVAHAKQYQSRVLAEQFIAGHELTVGVLQDQALPVIRIQPEADLLYDYHAKYVSDATRFHCPTGLGADVEAKAQQLAVRAFAALGCRHWGRVDMMLDKAGQLFLIEANTVPGMTSHSLVPKAAAAMGMSYQTLVWKILEMTLS